MKQAQAIFWTLLIGGFTVYALVADFRRAGQPTTTEATQEAESLYRQLPTFEARQDSVVQQAVAATAASTRATGRARAAEARSDSIRVVADSLEAEARRSDSSAIAWRAAHDARKREADSLRVALAHEKAATDSAKRAAALWQMAYLADSTRRLAVERVNYRIRQDIAKMAPPCQIGPLDCPSRRVAGVLGLIIGIAASR